MALSTARRVYQLLAFAVCGSSAAGLLLYERLKDEAASAGRTPKALFEASDTSALQFLLTTYATPSIEQFIAAGKCMPCCCPELLWLRSVRLDRSNVYVARQKGAQLTARIKKFQTG